MTQIIDLWENEQACIEVTLTSDNKVTVYYCGHVVEEYLPRTAELARKAFCQQITAIDYDSYGYICDVERRRI